MSIRARQAACKILCENRPEREGIQSPLLGRLSSSDRRHAHDLVMGVRRRACTWDAILDPHLPRGTKSVDPSGLQSLRLGVYALIMKPEVPGPIAISETVGTVRGSRKLRGFVNAVLRRVRESMVSCDLGIELPPRDRHRIELPDGRAIRFSLPVLPDPGSEPAAWASRQYSVHPHLASRMMEELPLEWDEFLRSSLSPLPLALRPRAGTTLDELARLVEEGGGRVLARREPVLEVRLPGDPGAFDLVRRGAARVQDLTASEVAPFVDVAPGQRVLDVCAAPGGKSVHMLELAAGDIRLTACHMGSRRLRELRDSLRTSGYRGTVLHDLGRDGLRWPTGPFDRILVDAPCSNTGVLMKRIDARYRCDGPRLESLAALQLGLLRRAASVLAPGGKIVYSTCSILPEENHFLVRAFLSAHPGLALEAERLRYPHRTRRDGGYMARLASAPAP